MTFARKHATLIIARDLVAIIFLVSAMFAFPRNGAETVKVIVLKTVPDVIGILEHVKNVTLDCGVRFVKRHVLMAVR